MSSSSATAGTRRREEDLRAWENELSRRQNELDDVMHRFRDEMVQSLKRLDACKREAQEAMSAVVQREAALKKAEGVLRAREQRVAEKAAQLAAVVSQATASFESEPTDSIVHSERPSTAAAARPPARTIRPPAGARYVDPSTHHDNEELRQINLNDLVVQGSLVMTPEGHILSPRDCAELLVMSGAFEPEEIEGLMRQGYSSSAILAEQLGSAEALRPGTPDRPRTRVATEHGVRYPSAHDDPELDEMPDEDIVVDPNYDAGEFDYVEDEEEEEEEEEMPTISLR